jgi:transcriptional regulator with XRE-family HTH domain
MSSGLSIDEVAHKAGVDQDWLMSFEAGSIDDGPNYDVLLKLIAATQPPRPDWWDSGHEHDLHLPSGAIRDKDKHPEYWERIEQVRNSNRRAVRS